MKDSRKFKRNIKKHPKKISKKPIVVFERKKKVFLGIILSLQDFLLPLCLFCLVGILFCLNTIVAFQIQTTIVKHLPIAVPSPMPYPQIKSPFSASISAEAAFIMEDASKVILFSKNPVFRYSPASTTKLITALTALDSFTLSQILSVKQTFIQESHIGLLQGEQMSFENLLYALLIPSANDSAITIADNFPEGESAFVAKMNEKAKMIHMDATHFADPAGLSDASYTTARDLAILGSEALKNPIISHIVAIPSYTVSTANGMHMFTFDTTNKLLGFYGVKGIKTGYTDEAKGVLITAATLKNHTYILVVMRSADRFADMKTLLSFLVNNITFVSIRP